MKLIKEQKPKLMIGTLRVYDHKRLLAFLDKVGVSLDCFVKDYDINSRKQLLAGAPKGVVATTTHFENITPRVGFELITKALSGKLNDVSEMLITTHAFGSGNTPAHNNDIKLQNETLRKAMSSVSYNGSKAYYTIFYELGEANGTHAEMGIFANADSGVADSGTLWDRTIETVTKTDVQTLTIDYEDSFINQI